MLEYVDELADEAPQTANRSLAAFPEQGFEAGEGLLDRIEVRAVGRKEAQCRTCCFDPIPDSRTLMARKIVHYDDVTGPQFRYENLGHVGLEPIAVDGTVQYHRCDHARHAQSRDQRGGLAVPVRETHSQSLAFGAAAMATGHVGGGPSFIDEDQASWFEINLPLEPITPLLQDVGTVLLDCMASLFLRAMPRRTKNR